MTLILGHCTFKWTEKLPGGDRVVEVEARHCARCVAELYRLGTNVVTPDRWPSGTKPPPQRVGDEVRILVVDDDDDARTVTAEMLRAVGYAVSEAHDGVTALARFEEVQPSVVILDLAMPVMDGHEVLRQMRATDAAARVPVIVLSADPISAKPEGCDLFLRKPVQPAILTSAVDLYARRARRRARPDD